MVGWYPITPSSSLCESLIGYLRKYRTDPDGKATFAAVQAVQPRTESYFMAVDLDQRLPIAGGPMPGNAFGRRALQLRAQGRP